MFLKIEDFMLPCLNKQLFGLECLGCGFQRSLFLIFQGNFKAAFFMYPAIYGILLLLLFLLLNKFYKLKHIKQVLITLAIINTITVIVSYFIKNQFIFT